MATRDQIYTIGSAGDDVADLQTLLGVRTTGTYDQGTADAVTRYQQERGLAVDGIVGDETLTSLLGTATGGAWAASTAAPSPATDAAPRAAALDLGAINLPGISDATKKALSDLVNNGYTPSASVDAALRELNDIIENEPGDFSSRWSGQIDAIMDQILNREDFSYDAANDPTYQIYKDLYQRQGRAAMTDAMGQAAALTGGYGNSWAQTAGQQAYQNYLTQLNGAVPELQAQALSRYQSEGQKLADGYSLLSGERAQEQAAWQQAYSQWAADRAFRQSAYDSAKQYDYGDYANRLSYLQNLAQQENAQHNADAQAGRQYAYQTAIKMLDRGEMPSNALLAAAGISAADAKKLRK